MLKNKRKLFLSLAGAMASLPMLVSAATVFEEVGITYDGGGSDTVSSAAVDLYGNMYLASVNGNDYHTSKFDSYGREVWSRIHSTGQASWIGKRSAMVVDRTSNSYLVLAESYNFGKVIKYDADGNESVLAQGGTTAYNDDHRVGLELDKGQNNLFVRASSTIKKISLDGGAGWTQPLLAWNTWVRDMAIDDSGNVYAVGVSKNTSGNTSTDVYVKKFDSDGNTLWSQLWYGEGYQNEDAYGLELDSNGNVYILVQALSYEESCLYCTTTSVVNISADGSQVTSTVLNGTDGYLAGGIKVAGDQVYVTIRNKTTGVISAQKLNADLSLAWSSDYSGGNVQAKALDVDGLGNMIVGVQGSYSALSLVGFDVDGNEAWIQSAGSGNPVFLKFGTTGEIYLAGTFIGPSDSDGFMNRYGVTSLTCQ